MTKIIAICYFLSFNIFCAEISFFEFIAEDPTEHNNQPEESKSSIYDFILAYPEKHILDMPQNQLINTYRFNYLFCIEIIDFLLKNEKSLFPDHKTLEFLKDSRIIGTIKNHLTKSINQETTTLANRIHLENTKEQLKTYSRLRKICLSVNRLSNCLLEIVFDFNNGNKPVIAITIDNIWDIYSKKCLTIKKDLSSKKPKLYAKICKKNDNLLVMTNNISYHDTNNQQEVIDLIKKLIKSMRSLSKYE